MQKHRPRQVAAAAGEGKTKTRGSICVPRVSYSTLLIAGMWLLGWQPRDLHEPSGALLLFASLGCADASDVEIAVGIEGQRRRAIQCAGVARERHFGFQLRLRVVVADAFGLDLEAFPLACDIEPEQSTLLRRFPGEINR